MGWRRTTTVSTPSANRRCDAGVPRGDLMAGHAGARVHAARAKKANALLDRVDDALTRLEVALDVAGMVQGDDPAERAESLAAALEKIVLEREEHEWEEAGKDAT